MITTWKLELIETMNFKKKWLSDKSGYWYQKKIKNKLFTLILNIDNGGLILDLKSYDKEDNKYTYITIKKCTLTKTRLYKYNKLIESYER